MPNIWVWSGIIRWDYRQLEHSSFSEYFRSFISIWLIVIALFLRWINIDNFWLGWHLIFNNCLDKQRDWSAYGLQSYQKQIFSWTAPAWPQFGMSSSFLIHLMIFFFINIFSYLLFISQLAYFNLMINCAFL